CQARLLEQDVCRPRRVRRAALRDYRSRQEASAPHVHRSRPRPIHRQPNPKGLAVSVFKDSRSPYWRYDFQIGGHRFYGSTKRTTRREAEAVARAEREKAKRHVAQARAAATSLRLDDVAGRYWQEIGQHHAGANNTERQIGYLIERFGKD